MDVESKLSELAAEGHIVVPAARAFLAEFSDLLIISEDGQRTLLIGGDELARRADVDWLHAYAESIRRVVTPVGEYSHMTLMIDESGLFWGGFDAEFGFMGESIVDVIRALLVEPGSRRLDREVAD